MIDASLIPALLIVIPILGAVAPLILGLRFKDVGWTIATVVSGIVLLGAVWVAITVYGGNGPVVHAVGGFEPPIGIELRGDRFSAGIALLVAGVSFGMLAYTRIGGPRGNTFYAGYLLLLGGLMGVTLTGDVFNLFVFLEITGIATYALVARGRGGGAAVAALKYLILGTLGASLYLIGVGFLFLSTGHLNMIYLGDALATLGYDDPLVRASFVFVVVGFAIKVAQWPVHTWQPDAYQRAPDGVTPLIAALVSTVSAYALGRVLYTVYRPEFLISTAYASELLLTIGTVSIVAGSVLAVMQWDIKRMLAYSSVSHFGMIVAAYGLVNETALLGAMVHLIGHGLMKVGLFVGVGVIAMAIGVRTIDEYGGLAKERPFVAGSIAIIGLALVGIPPSIGFIGKWYIGIGAVDAAVWPVAAVIFLSTMLTLAYVAKLGERMYFQEGTGPSHRVSTQPLLADGGTYMGRRPSIGMRGVLIVVAVVSVALGFAGAGFDSTFGPFVEEVFT